MDDKFITIPELDSRIWSEVVFDSVPLYNCVVWCEVDWAIPKYLRAKKFFHFFCYGGIGDPGIPEILGITLIPGKKSGKSGNCPYSRKIIREIRELKFLSGNAGNSVFSSGNPGIPIILLAWDE